ncbi:acetylornithine deacetylase/succinyl-diaminopimelate desuccinylase [Rothia mucilaginosa DY-18]|uniref:Acetylornithine deacetylase/succinyl-diaminopimelate desuccinylase n=2 Tax=Rothia mucilaginosa TaxID=43675 RepID=D2NTV2_ROTMD|nr:acetylornithine deacetylase/succinyl-diaminopimelate desuccinylase [Rothia mucilaginosa DY-18]
MEVLMLELRLIGVHDDGENLVLESADGTRFLLPIDANLRTSITKARRIQPARGLGAKGTYGPRDIQTRFRQGASVEEIAEESGWEPERVRRYEWPIVAERAHIIRAAQSVKIGRRDSASGSAQIPVTLSARIEEVSERYGFEEATQDWTTRQQENGQWRVEVDIALKDSVRQNLPSQVIFPARWVYNPANQGLYASNEAAYFLMGNSEDAVAAAAKKAPVEVPQARLPKAPEPAPAPLASSESADERKLKELLERARSVRPAQVEEPEVFVHRESAQPAEPVAPAAPAAPVASTPVAPAAPAAPEPTAETTVETTDPLAVDSEAPVESVPVESFALPAPVEDAPAAEAPAAEAQAEPAAEVPAEPASAAEKPKSSSKKQRVSVPAWDDIIFGGRK